MITTSALPSGNCPRCWQRDSRHSRRAPRCGRKVWPSEIGPRTGPAATMTAFSPVRRLQDHFALTFAASSPCCRRRRAFAFSAEARQSVHGRRVPPVQLGNSEHPEDHRPHDQALLGPWSSGCRTVMDRDLAAPGSVRRVLRVAHHGAALCQRFRIPASGGVGACRFSLSFAVI